VKLKYANLEVYVVEVVKDAAGLVREVVGAPGDGSAKHAIHWIPDSAERPPLKAEVREYDHLFMSEEPAKFPGNWIDDLNPNSLSVRSMLVDQSAVGLKPFDRVQFERVGYYSVDPDSKERALVFNRTVSLKESNWKKQHKK